MSAGDPEPEGPLGWTRLGCVTAVFSVLPIWGGFLATFIYLWGDDWPTRFGLDGPATFLGFELVTWVSAVQATLLLLLLAFLVGLGLGVARLVSGWLERRSRRTSVERYEALIGDGAVLRPDSWALTDGPEPDPAPPAPEGEGEAP